MKKMIALSSFVLILFFASCSDDDDSIVEEPVVAAAGVISGGPFEICVDGNPDFVSGISLDASNAAGTERTWVITDDQGNILGLPPTMTDVEGVDFDAAGPGVCLIWYMRYEGDITGAEMGMNANDIQGNYDLSNSIEVVRNEVNAGSLSGGPFVFDVDGTADFVNGIMLDSTEAAGSNSSWIITDDQGMILGLPPTLTDVEGVDFDGAGPGVCLIWYLRYEDGLQGLEAGLNANDLEGCFDLSNSIEVTRNGT